jgi:hypothetical protein
MATAPQATQEMPQQGANPFADPNTMAVYEQMRQTVSPKEFGDQMLAGAEQAAPEEVAAFRSALEQIELPPEALDLLNNMVDEILANPEQYAEIRAKYKEMGAPDEILPEQFDAQFFAALNMAVDQMIGEPAGVQAFAKGGIAELSPVSKAIAGYGRNGDTMLAHITPAEARMLRRKGGSGTINPKTGLPEYFNIFKEIGNAFKSIGKAVKSFVNSTVGRIVTTVALGFFLGPAAASFMGATSTAAVAAVSGFVGSAGSTLLGGGNIGQALKAGAMGGLTAGIGAGVMGGADAFAAGSYTGPTTIGGQFDRFTQAISPTSAAPAAPTDVLRDNVTTSTARDAYSTELAKANPEVFNNPNAAPAGESPFAAKKITLGGGLPEQITMPNGAVVTQNAANPFAPTSTNYGAFGEAPLNASAQTAVAGNAVAPPINTQAAAIPTATTGNVIAPGIGNAADATQFQGSLAKMAPGAEPSFFDNAKDFYNRNISPSGIQQQGVGAAQQAGAKAVTDLAARIPDATPAMREAAYQNAYKAAMPGVLSTYGPMTAVGIGAIGAFGGFTPKSLPISPFQNMLTGGPGSARDLMSKNPSRYYVQNLPGVNYYDGSVIKPTLMAEGGLASLAKRGRNGDTMLAHINPEEAQMLKRMGGSGTINPNTGLPEFFFDDDVFSAIAADGGGGGGGYGGGGGGYSVDISGGAGFAEAPQYVNDFYSTPGTVLATESQIDAGNATYNAAANAWEIGAPMAGSLDAGPAGNTIANTPFTAADLDLITGGTGGVGTGDDTPYTPLTVGGQTLTADQVAGAADTLTVSTPYMGDGINDLFDYNRTGATPDGVYIDPNTGLVVTPTTDNVPEITITGDRPNTSVIDGSTLVIPPGNILTPVVSDSGGVGDDVPEITITDDRPVTPPVVIDQLPPVVPPEIPEKPTCPAPEMRILLANGELKPAGDLQVGDVVKTQHENTLAWGEHPVTHVSLVPDASRLKFTFDDGEFVCSLDHKFFKAANEWVTAKDVIPGDMLSGKTVRSIEETSVGDVVRITIDDAHTYICEGLLSHNKSPLPPDVPEIVITDDRIVTPPVVIDPLPPVVPPIVEPPVKPPLPPIKPTCPAPEMRILLADGSLKAAGDLQVGDVLRTQHETTLAWGDHPVTHVSIVPDVPRLKIKLGDTEFVCSLDHKFFKAANEWVTAKDVVLGDMLSGHVVRSLTQADVGDVVRITVNDAHTYICEGLLSHNKTPEPPVVLPPVLPPVVVTPPYVPPVVVEPPYVPPTVPKIPVVPIGSASTDPRVAGVPGGSYMFTRNTPTFPTGPLSRTMSPYTGGITGLMPNMVIPPQMPSQMQGMPAVTPEMVNVESLNMGGIAGLAQGGYPRRTGQINGPGTATSDSIPAMLSDGEFVMTAKAVRGAGKGDRRAGAKRMYALMHQLEKNAARG